MTHHPDLALETRPSRTSATVVVVGAGYAGIMAANRLAGRARAGIRIVLVTERDELVHRVRLHEMAAGTRTQRYPLDTVLHPRVERVIDRVTRIDAAASACVLRSKRRISYDHLIVAVGSQVTDELPGAREHAMALANPDTALAFADRLRGLSAGSRVVVIGTGLTGIETACEIAAAHPQLEVTLLGETLAASWPDVLRARVRRELASLGVSVREGARVRALRADAVELEDGELPCAAAVWVAGFSCPPLARDSGLPVDELGRMVVDETLRVVDHPTIVGAGDAVAAPLSCVGTGTVPMRMACATAMPMGAHAADVVLAALRGRAALRFRYRNTVQCVSIGRKRGMLVFIDQDDRPTGRVLGAFQGALAKELICRLVIGALRIERRLAGAFWWPGRGRRRRALGGARELLPAGDAP